MVENKTGEEVTLENNVDVKVTPTKSTKSKSSTSETEDKKEETKPASVSKDLTSDKEDLNSDKEDLDLDDDEDDLEEEATISKKPLDKADISLAEFVELRKKVKETGQKKEWLFEVRSIISTEIKSLFSVLKKLKESRDVLTSNVHNLKKEREELNVEIKKLISKIKEFQKTTDPKKDFPRVDVSKLKKELERIQYHIETNPMSPEDEKKIMKQVKEKEKQISKAKNNAEEIGDNSEISKKINELKDKSNLIHDQVQQNAIESQEKHEEMIFVSKNIKFLKAREKEIHQLFTDIKEDYKVNRRVFMQNKKFYLSASSSKKRQSKSATKKDMIKKVEENIEDKIKRGQKITTEDLLSFRG